MNQPLKYSVFIKQLLVAIFSLLLFPCHAQLNWSYNTLNENKTEMDVAVNGNKIFFYSGYKRIGNTTVSVQELEVFDVRTGNKNVITLSGDEIKQKMATVSSGSKVYFAGGFNYDNIGTYNKKVRIYDTLTGLWTTEELSQGRAYFAAAAANGKVLFGGGYGTNEVNQVSKIVDIYNENNQTWEQSSFTQSIPGVGSQKRDLTAISIGDKIFFAGGDYLGNYRDMVSIYNSKLAAWLPNAALSQKKTKLKSVVYDNKAFFVGGTLKNDIPSDTIDVYDNTTDSWHILRIPYLFKRVQDGVQRSYVQAAQAGCKMFLLPFQDYSGSIPHNPAKSSRDSVAIYDFARNTWSYIGLPQSIFGTTIAAAENKIYFAGGREVATGLYTDLISILTLQPKLQSAIENTAVTSYNFGNVLQGEEKAIAVDFSNEGDYELLFADLATRISISGDVADFNIDYSSLQANDTLSPAEILSLPLTFNPTSNGLKQVTITIQSNDPNQPVYSFTVQGTGTDVTAVQDAAFSNSLQVYPNPTTGLLQVASKTQEPLYVEVLNTQGTRMKEGQYISNNEAVDLSSLSEGLYFLKIANATSSAVVKVIKK